MALKLLRMAFLQGLNKVSPRSGTGLQLGDSGDTITIPSGATLANAGTATGFASISWQSSIVTAATHTASAGQGLWLDTSSNGITLTLPASPSVGDQVIFTDYARNWGTNAVTLNLNSEKFQGNTTPVPVYDTNGESVDIVYSGSTKGWIPNSDGAVSLETPQTVTADFLVIAGGGGAGSDRGGGAGAGGYRNSYNSETSGGGGSSETALTLTPGQTYTVTVGGGGTGQTGGPSYTPQATAGVDSSISGPGITTITSTGGGYGGMKQPGGPRAGGVGGSGGGGHRDSGVNAGGAGTSNQGFAGEASDGSQVAGGGGGAAEAGGTDGGGYGGDGLSSSITGSAVARGGGGGGHNDVGSAPANAPGGDGGGGNGGYDGTPSGAGAGTVNTGGGGGGAGSSTQTGGAGGSGVVILRIPTAQFSGTTTGSPTQTTSGSDTILTFTGSGSYTA
jgi:hypothetical protein